MSRPTSGKIIIEWNALKTDPASGQHSDFDWSLSFDPPGLDDAEIKRLLRQVAGRI